MQRLSAIQIAKVNGKTTGGMLTAAVAYLLNQIAVPLLDGADFAGLITPEVLTVVLDLVMALGLIFAGMWQRDADKSSQDSGARKPIDAATIGIKVEKAADEALGRR